MCFVPPPRLSIVIFLPLLASPVFLCSATFVFVLAVAERQPRILKFISTEDEWRFNRWHPKIIQNQRSLPSSQRTSCRRVFLSHFYGRQRWQRFSCRLCAVQRVVELNVQRDSWRILEHRVGSEPVCQWSRYDDNIGYDFIHDSS